MSLAFYNLIFDNSPRTPLARVWAYVWLLAWAVMGVWAGCPKVCECKWRDGKEVVTCRDAHFIDIPRGLDPSTQVLDLGHNNLRILPEDSFVYTGLINLQKVWLNFCNLMRLERGAFRMLINVVELDVSNNFLRSIPSEALIDLAGLRQLRIAHNALTTITADAFIPTPELVYLDISHNSISVIETGALQVLVNLEVINLSDNKLKTIDAGEMLPLVELHVFHLESNPWVCDCELRPLRSWMEEKNLVASVPALCTRPRWLMGQDWLVLNKEEFICLPLVTAVAPRVLATEGENVSLACNVESEIDVTITWFAGDSPLQTMNDSLRYNIVETAGAYLISRSSNLTISSVSPEDQGTYHCIAENKAGRAEVNLTLQVSHEVAEVRIANTDTESMTGVLLGGLSLLAFVLLVVCSIIYCKACSHQSRQEDEEKTDTPNTSQDSSNDGHGKLAGYQIVPTRDLEDSSLGTSQTQHQWMMRDKSSDVFTSSSDRDVGLGTRYQETPTEGASVQPLPVSSVSYVEVLKSGISTTTTALEDRVRWDDPPCSSKDTLLRGMCSRSTSQVSICSSGQYPDLLDLPRSQFGGHLPQHLEQYNPARALQLHTLDPSYCTMPRIRSHGARGCGANQWEQTSTRPRPAPQHTASYRSSSALNLALSEAACQAYTHANLPVGDRLLLPTTPMLETHDPATLQHLIDAHRNQCAAAEDASCRQLDSMDPYRFQYHAAQLEKFLQEYRCLQEQLAHMKESYEAQQRVSSTPRLDYCPSTQLGPLLDPSTGFTSPTALVGPTSGVAVPCVELESLPVSPLAKPDGCSAVVDPSEEGECADLAGSLDTVPLPPPAFASYSDDNSCVQSLTQAASALQPKEPLKSILKKPQDTGKKQQQHKARDDRWTTSASSRKDLPPPQSPTDALQSKQQRHHRTQDSCS